MSRIYEREIYVHYGPTVVIFRATERPMLDPNFKDDPVTKLEYLHDTRGWVDVTDELTDKQRDYVMMAWRRAYDDDFCENEITQPSFSLGLDLF